jgi:ADP-ribose pyrophosphatase
VTGPDSSRTVYDGVLLDVVVERWDDREREIVEPPNAVVVVAVDLDGNVALVRQFREAARTEVLELPAGGIEPGETPLECARRELIEETGLTGGEWRHWGGFFTSPGYTRERMELFFAEGVTLGERAVIAGEDLAFESVSLAGVPDLLPRLEDAKTLTGLLLYLRERQRD